MSKSIEYVHILDYNLKISKEYNEFIGFERKGIEYKSIDIEKIEFQLQMKQICVKFL